MKRLRVFHRQLDAFLQLADGIADPANIRPCDIGHLNHDFAHGAWLDTLERREEILAAYIEVIEHFRRNGAFVQIDARHDPPHRVDRCFSRKRRDICPDKAISRLGQFVQVDPVAQRHAACVNAENFSASAFVGHADHDLAVEAPRPAQCLVNRFRSVGRRDHDQVRAGFQPVHQGQKLRNKPFFRFAWHAISLRRDRIDLVYEDDGRCRLRRLLEHFTQRFFAVAIARSHDLGTVDGKEVGIAFIGDGLSKPGLARSRRAVQQNALGRIDTQAREQFWVTQG